MIKSTCLKKDFVAKELVSNGCWRIRFSPYSEMIPDVDKDGNPTGETKESDWVIFTTQLVYGEELTPDAVRKVRLQELVEYDNSPAVNEFSYNGKKMWFDKNTRTAIAYSIGVEKASGAETTELYDNDGVKYVLPIDRALEVFSQLELYAKACYNRTAQHRDALLALDDVDELLAYDIRLGYPEKLVFVDNE